MDYQSYRIKHFLIFFYLKVFLTFISIYYYINYKFSLLNEFEVFKIN